MGGHVRTSEKRRQIIKICQLAVSVSKTRVIKRKIIYEKSFELKGRELTC